MYLGIYVAKTAISWSVIIKTALEFGSYTNATSNDITSSE